jgi:hypothetical protein
MNAKPDSTALPTVVFDDTPLYHVGHLDEKRRAPKYSHEGAGLSVSRVPDAWRRIARIGGTDYVLRLDRSDGGVFLLETELTDDERDEIEQWCVDVGFVEHVDGYESSCENIRGEERTSWGYERADVMNADVESEDAYTIREKQLLQLGPCGRDYWQDSFTSDPDNAHPVQINQLVPVWFAQAHDYEGVWWDYRLDPADYSAPCGVIYQEKLIGWKIEER